MNRGFKTTLLRASCTAGLATSMLAASASAVYAQGQDNDAAAEETIFVTGTRIQNPNIVAASPVTTVGRKDLDLAFTPNIERVFRDLPITIPGDGQNVNNGSAGRAEIDLRGLGPERSLIMIDGKRINPQDIDGIVDTNFIPLIMLERVDIITGGASAVYGSDAMSGAVNFILKKDFEGIELDTGFSTTNDGGGDVYNAQALVGTNTSDGRGNVTMALTWTKRNQVLLADREFGQFGVSSVTGSGLGEPPARPEAGCQGNTEFTTAAETRVGSTTAIPGTLNIFGGGSYQFRDDGSLGTDTCSRFNFAPFNYYQTPQERWQIFTSGRYEINDNAEFYARGGYSSTVVDTQIAPSGTFGQSFDIPLLNPFFNDAARTFLIADRTQRAADFVAGLNATTDADGNPLSAADIAANQALLAADPMGFNAVGIIDGNRNGVFDTATVDGVAGDSIRSTARRRTLELGPRSSRFVTNQYQVMIGLRGEAPLLPDGWTYDLSWQRGVSDFVETRDGYTNLTNIATALNTVDASQCITPAGQVTAAPCTPINVFGPVGSITEEQRDSGYFLAIASDLRRATQTVLHGSFSGEVEELTSPFADTALSLALGFEYRKEEASSSPDVCLQLPPASCQGGAGGNRLPIAASYTAWEGFIEGILPVVEGAEFAENISLEFGYRFSSFNPQGNTSTWKIGTTWEPVSGLRLRYMEQRAVRVANIGELASPRVTGLDNATEDPCSISNAGNIDAALRDLCVRTGVPGSQVGVVDDIISGQVNVFEGTDPANLPDPEVARTRTAGLVWSTNPSEFIGGNWNNTTFSLDYYRINIEDYIDTPSGQEALDACYLFGDLAACDGIVRVGGTLSVSGAGVPALFTNFTFFRASGIQLGLNTGYNLDSWGSLNFAFNANIYLSNELQTFSVAPVVDCNGRYGTTCDPVPTYRHTARLGWNKDDAEITVLWRRIGGMEAQENEAEGLFEAFRSVGAQNYFDVTVGYQVSENLRLNGAITNLANKRPPILGNATGTTAFNSGNTFPSLYDVVGRVFRVNARVSF